MSSIWLDLRGLTSGSIKGGMGASRLFLPLAPQKKKMVKMSHFWQICGFLPPQKWIFPPRCPPTKNFWCCHWLFPRTISTLRPPKKLFVCPHPTDCNFRANPELFFFHCLIWRESSKVTVTAKRSGEKKIWQTDCRPFLGGSKHCSNDTSWIKPAYYFLS